MEIQHEIVLFDATTGVLSVRYFCAEYMDGFVYSVDLPLENGVYPDSAEITAIVNAHAPVKQLERVVSAKNAEVPAYLAQFVAPRETSNSSEVFL